MKYKLLKDTPKTKADAIFEKPSERNEYYSDKSSEGFWFDIVENNPEWFEIVDDRWKPKHGEKYYYIDFCCYVRVCSGGWTDNIVDRELYKSNRCFKTKQHAEEALEAVKKVLKEKWEGYYA